MIYLLAEAAGVDVSSWTNLTATGIIASLLVWIITKAFPDMMERQDRTLELARNKHEVIQARQADHFEKTLDKIETSRAISAKEGHEAAKVLADSIINSTNMLKENTRAVDALSQRLIDKA